MRAAGIPHDPEPAPLLSATAEFVRAEIMPAAFALLPARLDSRAARVMVLAIGLQESRFEHRRQVRGPARGFWQFEHGGGVRGVLRHAASRPLLLPILATLQYESDECFEAIVHNDVLACVFARLLLWTHPKPLPADADAAWRYYIDTWRPGKPHPETWGALYDAASAAEEG